jgi:hypothetical protein
LRAKWLGGICFVIGAAATPFVVLGLSAMANRVQAPVVVDYAAMLPDSAQDQTCSAREAPQEDSIIIEDGLKINVRTPANYDRTRAHPLLVALSARRLRSPGIGIVLFHDCSRDREGIYRGIPRFSTALEIDGRTLFESR